MTFRRSRQSIALLCLLALFITACGGGDDGDGGDAAADDGGDAAAPTTESWDDVVAAAQDEGELTLLSLWTPEDNARIEEGFEAAYPDIDLEVIKVTGTEVPQRVDAESAAGDLSYDAVLHSIHAWHLERAEDPEFWAPLVGPDVQAAAEYGALEHGDFMGIVSGQPYGYAWRDGEVEGEPTLEDLVSDPGNDGRIGIYDYAASPTLLTMAMLMEEELGEEWMEQLAERDPRFYASTVPMVQALSAGEVDITIPMLETAAADVSNVTVVYPETPLALRAIYGAFGEAEHPNAAQLLANWLLSPEGQEAYAVGAVSMLPDIPSAAFGPDQVRFFDGLEYDQAEMDAGLEHLNEVFGR